MSQDEFLIEIRQSLYSFFLLNRPLITLPLLCHFLLRKATSGWVEAGHDHFMLMVNGFILTLLNTK